MKQKHLENETQSTRKNHLWGFLTSPRLYFMLLKLIDLYLKKQNKRLLLKIITVYSNNNNNNKYYYY